MLLAKCGVDRMAIEESDREDLMREAIRYRERLLITCPGWGEGVELFVGRRENGAVSVYWTSEEVYQFNVAGELRRVFFHGAQFAAEDGVLVRLLRESRGGRVQLIRQSIDEQQWRLLEDAWSVISTKVRSSLEARDYRIEQSIPEVDSIPEWIVERFRRTTKLRIAKTSHVE